MVLYTITSALYTFSYTVSTNQRLQLYSVDQSETSFMQCRPIRAGCGALQSGQVSDLFSLAVNEDARNYVAGRSVACVDRKGTGVYDVMVANYGEAVQASPWLESTTRYQVSTL